ncbi:MAG: OsmC family protein [Candidatus Omnitrophota bacterium]
MYEVRVEHTSEMQFITQSNHHVVTIDAKGEKALTPPAMLLGALGSCIGVYIRKYTKNTQLDLKNFVITVTAEFSAEKPVHFKTINVSIDFKDAVLDEKRKESIMRFIKNCPVHNTLAQKPEIVFSLS